MTTNIDEKKSKPLGFNPMLNLIKLRKMDGFYVSKDNIGFINNKETTKTIEKLKLIPYPAPGGTFYIKAGLHERYGYETPEDFAHDCNLGLLECKSVEGALSLGPIRRLTSFTRLYLYGSGLNAAPIFLADSLHQVAAITKVLEKAYPGATVRALENDNLVSLERLQPGMNQEHWKILFREAPPLLRLWFRYLVEMEVMVLATLVLNSFGYISQPPVWIFLVSFFACFLTFTGLTRHTGFTRDMIQNSRLSLKKRSSRKN